jgi:hypothetical protein
VRIWVAGVVYAVGQPNFQFVPDQTPHATAGQLSERLGVNKSRVANRARLIRDSAQLGRLDTQFMRRDVVEASPLGGFWRWVGSWSTAAERLPTCKSGRSSSG